jgi:hypothetical protein
VAQVVEHLLCKQEALNSHLNPAKKKKKKKRSKKKTKPFNKL